MAAPPLAAVFLRPPRVVASGCAIEIAMGDPLVSLIQPQATPWFDFMVAAEDPAAGVYAPLAT